MPKKYEGTIVHKLKHDGELVITCKTEDSSPVSCYRMEPRVDVVGFSNLLLLTPEERRRALILDINSLNCISGKFRKFIEQKLAKDPDYGHRSRTDHVSENAFVRSLFIRTSAKWNLEYTHENVFY